MAYDLVELRVRNLGVIEDVTVGLGPGMTALTGETGAGKTLLVQAVGLLLGGRADASMIRAGAEEVLVEARFVDPSIGDPRTGDLAAGAPAAGETVLARSIVRGGRSRAWIDGRMASQAALGEVARELVELHGQHEHRTLTQADAQRVALDGYAGIDLTALDGARGRLRALVAESRALGGDSRQRAREVDLLRYQVDEIDGAAIADDAEDARLEAEEDRLASASACRQAAADALGAVSGSEERSALGMLADASGSLGGHAPLAALESRVRSAMGELADLSAELRRIAETWEDDPDRLDEVRRRRQLFRELERKYGGDLPEVLAFADDARERLAAIGREEHRAVELDAGIRSAREELAAAEAAVAEGRRRAAPRLAEEIESTLRSLAMPSARFSISVEGDGPADSVTFLLGANPGEPEQPLGRIASGGELARTMLAVRLATGTSAGVMVFDEVDAGVGGTAATAVGAALAGVARAAQVLVVTHLAQVAALADHQIEVHKEERKGRTSALVAALDDEGRVLEISRMLSGHPESQSARQHAQELLGGERAAAKRG